MQLSLEEKILQEHPELLDRENLPWKVLALQVEVGELANEWRGFKKWSKNTNPSKIIHTTAGATEKNAVEFVCADEDCGERFDKSDARLQDLFGENNEDCPVCKNGYLYAMRSKNPILEEFADCVHLTLSNGLELADEWFIDYDYEFTDKLPVNLNVDLIIEQFQMVYRKLAVFHTTHSAKVYVELVAELLRLGKMLGFTWEQIEQAYISKNEINHNRQATGY